MSEVFFLVKLTTQFECHGYIFAREKNDKSSSFPSLGTAPHSKQSTTSSERHEPLYKGLSEFGAQNL